MPVTVASTPFAILDSEHFRIAVDEVSSHFPADAKKAVRKMHEEVAEPIQAAARSGSTPSVLSAWTLPKPDGAELYLVAVGKKVFPMVVREAGWGERELRLYPPLLAKDVDDDRIRNKGLKGLYDENLGDLSRIFLRRGDRPATDAEFGDVTTYRDISYAWALWETASGLLRSARANTARARDQADADRAARDADVLNISVPSAPASIESILAAAAGASGELPSTGGPPVGHDLVDATSWNGRAVAVTTERDTSQTARVWLSDRKDGQLVWREIPLPDASDLPRRGVSMTLAGDTLHLVGSVDRDGKPESIHWEYDLRQGQRLGFDATAWSRGEKPGDGVAWPVVACVDDRPHVVGGVAGFYVRASDGSRSLDNREINHRRGMEILGQRWATRSAAPGEVTGASSVSGRDFFIVGPGNKRDGKVYLYHTGRGGAWYVLPDLPREVGLGQVILQGDTLIYAGGFDKNGKPSKAMWALDLNSMAGEWRPLGNSPYAAGKARLVEVNGRWWSVMVTPKASRAYQLA
jgi:hypothetical protein